MNKRKEGDGVMCVPVAKMGGGRPKKAELEPSEMTEKALRRFLCEVGLRKGQGACRACGLCAWGREWAARKYQQ